MLKSDGLQEYSYLYVADAVLGLLWILTRCNQGKAYNVASFGCETRLRDLAGLVAEKASSHVVFELPDDVERVGYSTATKALLDGSRLASTGWHARYDLADGVGRTLEMLRDFR